jgi:hypothetical protein
VDGLGNGIMPAGRPGMAPADASHGQRCPMGGSVPSDGLDGVLGTGGGKPAARPAQQRVLGGRHGPLVRPQQEKHRCLEVAHVRGPLSREQPGLAKSRSQIPCHPGGVGVLHRMACDQHDPSRSGHRGAKHPEGLSHPSPGAVAYDGGPQGLGGNHAQQWETCAARKILPVEPVHHHRAGCQPATLVAHAKKIPPMYQPGRLGQPVPAWAGPPRCGVRSHPERAG